ncbi:MAG: hypothetical protein GY711_05625 [bacterium]|nr:hypothetical protein [bacterium]
MHRQRSPLLLALLLSFSLPAAAQSPYFETAFRVLPANPNPPTPLTAAITGFFTENARRDAVFLQGTTPVLLHSPATYRSSVRYDTAVAYDLATCRKPEWNRDGFALVGPGGVSLVRYEQGGFVADPLNVSELVGTSQIVVADFDGNGVQGIAAFHDAAQEMRVVIDALGGGTAVTSFSVETPLDLLALDFGHAAGQELAIAGPSGLAICDWRGVALETVPSPPVEQAVMTTFQDSATPHDRLAVVFRIAGFPDQILITVGGAAEDPVLLGQTDIYALCAGRVDGDGDEDLIALDRACGDALVALNQSSVSPATFPLVAGHPFGVDAVLDASSVSEALYADFDADGDDDFLCFDSSRPAMLLYSNRLEDPAGGRLQLDADYRGYYTLQAEPRTAELEFAWTRPANPLANATDVEFTVWRRPASSATVESQALAFEYAQLPPDYESQTINIRIENAPLDLEDTLVLEGRLVRRAGGAVLAAGPAWTAAFQPAALETELEQIYDVVESIEVYFVPDPKPEEWPAEWVVNPPAPNGGFELFSREDSGIVPLPTPPDHDEDPPVFGSD